MNFRDIPVQNQRIAAIMDDHILFGDSFSLILEKLSIFKSIHTFYKEKEFLQFVGSHHNEPLYLFIDYYLKDQNSLPLINDVKRLSKKSKIIIVSSLTNPLLIKNILDYHPQGFISKSSGVSIITECIRSIDNGKMFVCPEITDIISSFSGLKDIPFTPRELHILNLFAQGLSIDQTADKTFLSRHTVVAHRRKMMEKTKTHSITELLAYCRRLNLI